MAGQSVSGRRRPTRVAGSVAGIGLLAAASTIAAPTRVPREVPAPVTAIDRKQLETLPANRDLRSILELHNQLRSRTGARPLRWNPTLAANAERYAHTLAALGTVQHSSRVGREDERENIVVGPRSGISPLQMVQIWVREAQVFRPGTYPNVCAGDWSKCSHYTQMIWPTTTDVGCGYVRGRFDALVCRYSPPGNKDGVYLGPTQVRERQTAGGLCTTPRGLTIPCQNAPGGVPVGDGGGTIQDDGGPDKDTGVKEEVACTVTVNVHRPISVAADEPVIPEAEKLSPGATTLRNDDSDWRLGGQRSVGTLPVTSLPTDLTRGGNPRENDLVKVVGLNPNGLTGVYLFAFPIDAETDISLGTKVKPVTDGEHAEAHELGYFNSATKAGPSDPRVLPGLVPRVTTLWLEAKLGGRYRMVIGKLKDGIAPGDVRYDRSAGAAVIKKTREDPFVCNDQATVTAAIVDIFQKKDSERLTAFEVYWGGRPHFRAEVWPGGNVYRWGAPYKIGAEERTMPGTAEKGEVAGTKKDREEDASGGHEQIDGTEVEISGNANGGPTVKGRIEGGFLMRKGDDGPVPNTAENRYPERVSLGYTVNGEPLVRAEYLEVIMPQVRPPGPRSVPGSPTGVESEIAYTIVDAFDRPIRAPSVPDYVHLYGASVKAWEALMTRDNPRDAHLQERGRKNDFLELVNVGVTVKGKPLKPIRFGTAQRSQALVRADRMTDAVFTDTLRLDLIGPNPDKPLWDHNNRDYLWMAWSGLVRRDANERYDARATRAASDARRAEARVRAEKIRKGESVAADDARRSAQGEVLAIPQDVILQIRSGDDRHDWMVFHGNRITLFPPFFFTDPGFPGYDQNNPGSALNKVFYYNIEFTPGSRASQLVDKDHQRPR